MPSEYASNPTDRELSAIAYALQTQLDVATGSVGIKDVLFQKSIEDNVIEGNRIDFGSKAVLISSEFGQTSGLKVVNAPSIEGSEWIAIKAKESPTLLNLVGEDLPMWTFRLPSTTTASSAELAMTFQELVDEWRSHTAFYSSLIDIVTNPAYQRIIGMGRSAIPLILRELSTQPDHWFWALKAITREDPVPDQDQGDLVKMRTAWLSWGAANGYDI